MKNTFLKFIKWFCIILNTAIGYCLPIYLTLVFIFIINRPKGLSYYIPKNEYPLNLFFAVVALMLLLIAELLINVPANKLWISDKKKLVIIKFAFMALGVIIYFVFNGPEDVLRMVK